VCHTSVHHNDKEHAAHDAQAGIQPALYHADLVLYNTCTVRENANLKIYGRLGYLSKIKEKNPEMIIGLCGCMMQEPQVVEKLNKSYRFVDIIFGTHNVFQLAELLYDRLIGGHRIEDIWDGTTEIVEDLPTIRKYDFKLK